MDAVNHVEQNTEGSELVPDHPEDFLLWDYDAVNDYVYALIDIDDLIDVEEEIGLSKVLSPQQIKEIESLIDTRINKIDAEKRGSGNSR